MMMAPMAAAAIQPIELARSRGRLSGEVAGTAPGCPSTLLIGTPGGDYWAGTGLAPGAAPPGSSPLMASWPPSQTSTLPVQ
jgi:hypothetical protein